LALFCALATVCVAEKLPVTTYTTGNGLTHNNVQKIFHDSRGFIWFATREGLSRFDGYTFTNYGVDDGLPSAVVTDLLETRAGVYLIATAGGLARLEMDRRRGPGRQEATPAGALFSVHQISNDPATRHVLTLYEDRRGKVWIGTRAGLFTLEDPAGKMTIRPVAIGSRPSHYSRWVLDIREDRFGTLWVSTPPEVRRIWPDGRIDSHLVNADVQAILEDRAGHLWLGTRQNGLQELTFDEPSGRVATRTVHNSRNGLPSDWINTLFEPRAGELWAGTPGGLMQIVRTAAHPPGFRLLSEAHGLGRGVQSIASDRSGNVWLGTLGAGALKIAHSGFTSFGAEDGFTWGTSLVQTRSGDLCFASGIDALRSWGLYCFNGTSFDPIGPKLEQGAAGMSWGWKRLVIEARTGGWWFATKAGVARFGSASRPHDLKGRSPNAVYAKREGLLGVILSLLEDSRGDVWIAGVVEGARSGLSRWERSTGAFHHYSNEQHLPDLNVHFPGVLAEDRSGNVWIGFSGTGGIARYRNGRFDRLETRDLFQAAVRDIVLDSAGRLWIASYRGLFRVDDPAAASPVFRQYTIRDGLSSNETSVLVEDAGGRLYVGTARGLDRLDPATGRIKHFSVSDGLPLGEISSAVLDRRTGHLWFTQSTGVVRLIPPADPPPVEPPILINAVQINSEPQPLQPLGERTAPALELSHDRNHLRIEFVALGFGPGEDLRYQYRLEGAGDAWSTPSSQRTVNFANLAPGTYRFSVRAINADGVPSAEPATVAFTIVPPVWQRWWFLALAAAAVVAVLYAIYRVRLARAVEIATMRTRIATDLHDDIGANLTKIAILSEVARQHLDGNTDAGDRLSTIARISRESVSSMSDVVWAINPRRDTLRDTIRRMRQHVQEVLAGRGLDLEFHAPEVDLGLRVPIDVRRDFFLIFKEALNNAVRHSRCRKLRIEVNADVSSLSLRLTDDGVGFDTSVEPTGNGLASMRRRAEQMNAALEVVSTPGRGTSVSVSVRRSVGRRLRHPA
jgi:signal transduction histidine kinase/ligand-binding sensor domain-containing protein